MKTSAAGRALITQREGRRLATYRDSKGILTIGVGHTGRMSPPPVTAGMTIGDAQCDAMLATDLVPVEAAINAAVKVPIAQNEFDALASLGFNIGVRALQRATVLRRLNLGDIAGAATAFMMWDHPAVLEGRRQAERAQFLTPDRMEARPIAAARAATLATRAETTKAQAQAAQSGAAALAVASASAAVTTHAHHPVVALVVGGLLFVGGAGVALVAAGAHGAARTLALNAARQAIAAKPATALKS